MALVKTLEERGYPVGWESFFEDNLPLIKQVDNVIIKKEWEITPIPDDVFKVYELLKPSDIKVIIMGMDPYYNGSAMGLAFSVNPEYGKVPPSLKNIFKVIKKNTGKDSQCAATGDLTPWAKQGVFLLNASLTATYGSSGGCGKVWDGFIVRTLEYIFKLPREYISPEIDSEDESNSEDEEEDTRTKQQINHDRERSSKPITLLWGQNAKAYEKYCTGEVLTTSHPSPFSYERGFSNCDHFSQVNTLLKRAGHTPIVW